MKSTAEQIDWVDRTRKSDPYVFANGDRIRINKAALELFGAVQYVLVGVGHVIIDPGGSKEERCHAIFLATSPQGIYKEMRRKLSRYSGGAMIGVKDVANAPGRAGRYMLLPEEQKPKNSEASFIFVRKMEDDYGRTKQHR